MNDYHLIVPGRCKACGIWIHPPHKPLLPQPLFLGPGQSGGRSRESMAARAKKFYYVRELPSPRREDAVP